ncbi:MAG: transposase [Bacteroidota bacterium]|nr:transposase [Bacteroidota bacterium]
MPSKAKGQRPYGNHKCIGPNECFAPALKTLEKYIHIKTQGKWNQKQIHTSSLGMAAERLSIHSIQNIVENNPTETPFRNHLSKLNMDDLEKINHLLLTNKLLDQIPKETPIRFAIDETDDPYYGTITLQNKDYVVGSDRKKSTSHFYRYHSLYLILGDWKITLYVIPVKKKSSKLEHIKQMIGIIDEFGFSIEVLLLDRGYYSKEIFRYLMKKEIPHIMPVKNHSAEMKRLLIGRRSRFDKYTMTPDTDPLQLDLAINVTYLMGKRGKNGVKNIGYFYYGLDWKPNKIASVYKKRFGIEASYRMRNIVRIKTSSRNPIVRYYFALVSMLLKNIWVFLRWKFFPQKRRGPRRVDEDAFRFDRFRLFIWQAFGRRFVLKKKIPVHTTKR